MREWTSLAAPFLWIGDLAFPPRLKRRAAGEGSLQIVASTCTWDAYPAGRAAIASGCSSSA